MNQEIEIFLRNMKENRELYNEARDAIKINKIKLDWKSSITEKEVRKKKRYFTSNYLIEIKKLVIFSVMIVYTVFESSWIRAN